jgi:putative membrane protein
MFLDWVLASLHHLAVFSLMAILAAEFVLIRNDINSATIRRINRVDLHYGVAAGLIILFGFLRVYFGAKGHEYYFANHIFWLKILLFLVVGVLSIWPTLRFIDWRRHLLADDSFRPDPADVASIRKVIWIEAGLFLLIPIAAAAMARGYGLE